MEMVRTVLHWLGWVATFLLQVIMTQVITFLFSLLLPGMENFPQTNPVIFIILLGVSYSIGVFLAGWLALRRRWLPSGRLFPQRLAGALTGAYVALIMALIFYHPLEPGNPFFFIAILTCILGFYLPGWVLKPAEV